jgi:hypothetical protein
MDSEQLRNLVNNVNLRGTLAELEVREGTNKNGIAYISLKGAVRFGDTGVETKRFRTYVQAQKSDGNDNKTYPDIKKWADDAVSEADNKELATKVSITGSLEANDYISSSEELVEAIEINAKFFNEFKETDDDPACVDVEGYIKAIQDEMKNDEPTGRKKVTLITTDFFRNAVVVKNIIVPEDLAERFCEMFDVGDTAVLYLSYMLHKGEAKPKKTNGLGRQRVTEGKDYLELILVGADDPEDMKEPIEKKVVKILMEERAQKLKDLEEEGYQGTSESEATAKSNKKGSAKKTTKVTADDIDDDDIPF